LKRALLMQFNIFLIISTLLVVKPTVNGLFLAKFGVEQLPFAFILVAIVAALVSMIYSRLLARVSLYKINISTLIISVVCLLLFGVFLRFNFFEGTVLYLFYIWVAIFALLTTSQFWVLANMVFNPREAKRLFGFVGAGAIAGGIFGGYLTLMLAENFGSENLPFVCAAILSLCIPITRQVWTKNVVAVVPQFERRRRIKRESAHPWKLIRQSKHLTYIACIVGVSVMVAKLVDYQFSGIASRLIPDADELTAFFGFWFSTFNVISLLVQLFLTRRMVGTFGVGTSLFILPGMILVAAVLLLIFPELLMAAIFLKMADGGLKQSINKASMELLIMPISKEVKNQTKTFIDVFVDSLATGIIGLLLVFVIKGLDLPMITVSWMILGLLFLWIYFADKVRKEYLRTFQLILKKVAPKEKKIEKLDLSNVSVLNGLRKVMEEGDETQTIFVLGKLRETPDERLFGSIKKLLDHPSDEVKAEALQCLYFLHSENLSQEVKRFIYHPLQKVKIAAFEYLLQKEPSDGISLMKQFISDEDHRVSSAALVSLAKETRQNPNFQKLLDLEMIIGKKIREIAENEDDSVRQFLKISILKAIGHANFANYYHIIKQYFSDPDEMVVKEAITAAGYSLSTLFINDLLRFLLEKQFSATAEKALVHYQEGLIPILDFIIDQPDTKLETLRKIPAVVKNMSRQSAVDLLIDMLDHPDGTTRLEALRGLNHQRIHFPHHDFKPKRIAQWILDEAKLYQNTLTALQAQILIEKRTQTQIGEEIVAARRNLISLLDKRLNKSLERIFRLLGLKYPPDDIFHIYHGLNKRNAELNVSAIEFLDNLLEPSIKKVLIPLVETSMLETISEEAIRNLKLKIPTETECFQLLLKGKDNQLKIATLTLISRLGNRNYLPLLDQLCVHPDEMLRHAAQQAKKELTNE